MKFLPVNVNMHFFPNMHVRSWKCEHGGRRNGGALRAGVAGAGGCAWSRWPAAGPLAVPSARIRRARPCRGRSPACLVFSGRWPVEGGAVARGRGPGLPQMPAWGPPGEAAPEAAPLAAPDAADEAAPDAADDAAPLAALDAAPLAAEDAADEAADDAAVEAAALAAAEAAADAALAAAEAAA